MNETIIDKGLDFEVKKKKKVALDVDDVLGAFTPHAHTFFDIPLEKCDYWCEKTMNAKFGMENWFTGHLKLLPEFWETLPVLSSPEDIDFEVAYYISAFDPKIKHYREDWLNKHGFPDAPLICSYDKVTTCKELGIDILVDDKPATIVKFREAGLQALHFITPYAGFEPIGDYITSLKQVKQYI